MVAFIDAATLLQRKKLKKMEKKEEKKYKERKQKKEKEEPKPSPAEVKLDKKEEVKEELKKEEKKKRTMPEDTLVIVDATEDSPFVRDKRSFLVYRMGHPKALMAQKKREIKVSTARVIRRERTASEEATDGMVVVV